MVKNWNGVGSLDEEIIKRDRKNRKPRRMVEGRIL